MNTDKILKLKEIYEEFLKIIEITKSCEDKFKQEFNISDKDKYKNPFWLRYDLEKVINDVKMSVISKIITIFNKEYPNIDLDNKHLEKFIEVRINKYEHEEKGEIIYFEKIIKYLEELESHKESFALQYLTKLALQLIPYNLRKKNYNTPRKFKAEEIIKGDKLILYCGYSYEHPNKEYISYILKLINTILSEVNPATAEEYNEDIYIKYYQNGRFDIQFQKLDNKINKENALKVAKFLEENQEVKNENKN
jgi:hypothetical protein